MHLFKSALVSLCAFSSMSFAEPVTVPFVDLSQYVGRWYQISANPMPFDKGCHCSQQTLTALQNGNVGVHNSCNLNSPTGPLSEIRGEASSVDKISNAKFIVDFNLPWKGDYWIVGLDPDYTWAVVSEPKGDALFILSRVPAMTPEAFSAATAAATAAGVDISRLVETNHKVCGYPPM